MNASTEQKKTHTEPNTILERIFTMPVDRIESSYLKIESLVKDLSKKQSSAAPKKGKSAKSKSEKDKPVEASETAVNRYSIFKSIAYEFFVWVLFVLIGSFFKAFLDQAFSFIVEAIIPALRVFSNPPYSSTSLLGKYEFPASAYTRIAMIFGYTFFRFYIFSKFFIRHMQRPKMDIPFVAIMTIVFSILFISRQMYNTITFAFSRLDYTTTYARAISIVSAGAILLFIPVFCTAELIKLFKMKKSQKKNTRSARSNIALFLYSIFLVTALLMTTASLALLAFFSVKKGFYHVVLDIVFMIHRFEAEKQQNVYLNSAAQVLYAFN
ncbi:hypothetical protein NEMIN01_1291 [Nematocida minor]|uniref:uncharacterized protein n=1 Tax=Nematocida minor TaxID=1912983 RepID=UPI00221E8D58|nr:uncharacterized protein NEMIN01_1291 [Nematocida minor]KAI5190958.1 hypothetical protein NEMIN01_1291 [Nematocida minor]